MPSVPAANPASKSTTDSESGTFLVTPTVHDVTCSIRILEQDLARARADLLEIVAIARDALDPERFDDEAERECSEEYYRALTERYAEIMLCLRSADASLDVVARAVQGAA